MFSRHLRSRCPTLPTAAPLDACDRVLALYFRRAVRAAALGSVCASGAACGEHPAVQVEVPPTPPPSYDAAAPSGGVTPSTLVFDASVQPLVITGEGCPRPSADFYNYLRFGCDAGLLQLGLDLSTLALPTDFVALRDLSLNGMAWPGGEAGEACASATDAGACQTALAALCDAGSCIVTTRGDRVEAWTTTEQVQQLFGSIDSPGEALALILRTREHPSRCRIGDFGYQVLADGYALQLLELQGSYPSSPDDYQRYRVTRDGGVERAGTATGPSYCPGGRRPPGLMERTAPAACGSALGRYLAALAHLEAASIPAFESLARELAALSAPAFMLRKVRQAIEDERDHRARIGALAQRHGQRVERPILSKRPLRGAAELALDNVVEGCVRESFGAVLATFQAERAQDPVLRATFSKIARDETRHAALAFQIQAWLAPRLRSAELAQVRAARGDALAALRRDVAQPVEAALVAPLGLPLPHEALALLDQVAAL